MIVHYRRDPSREVPLPGKTDKVALQPSASVPLCPWCDAPLPLVHWHKVRAGPPIGYVAILACPRCRGVLEGIAHTDHSPVIV